MWYIYFLEIFTFKSIPHSLAFMSIMVLLWKRSIVVLENLLIFIYYNRFFSMNELNWFTNRKEWFTRELNGFSIPSVVELRTNWSIQWSNLKLMTQTICHKSTRYFYWIMISLTVICVPLNFCTIVQYNNTISVPRYCHSICFWLKSLQLSFQSFPSHEIISLCKQNQSTAVMLNVINSSFYW